MLKSTYLAALWVNNILWALKSQVVAKLQRVGMMFEEMKTYKAVDQSGKTILVSAYTESEARQKAEEELGWGNVIRFEQV